MALQAQHQQQQFMQDPNQAVDDRDPDEQYVDDIPVDNSGQTPPKNIEDQKLDGVDDEDQDD